MKNKSFVYWVFVACMAVTVMSCNNQPQQSNGLSTNVVNVNSSASGKANNKMPVMTFAVKTHDFGKITQGEKVTYAFKFKNTGNADLVISSAKGSCGCTVPEYPKDPVAPGANGVINVTFDSVGKMGKVEKTVTLVTNTSPNTKILVIKADIQLPPKH